MLGTLSVIYTISPCIYAGVKMLERGGGGCVSGEGISRKRKQQEERAPFTGEPRPGRILFVFFSRKIRAIRDWACIRVYTRANSAMKSATGAIESAWRSLLGARFVYSGAPFTAGSPERVQIRGNQAPFLNLYYPLRFYLLSQGARPL